jgi:hypothetical protein
MATWTTEHAPIFYPVPILWHCTFKKDYFNPFIIIRNNFSFKNCKVKEVKKGHTHTPIREQSRTNTSERRNTFQSSLHICPNKTVQYNEQRQEWPSFFQLYNSLKQCMVRHTTGQRQFAFGRCVPWRKFLDDTSPYDPYFTGEALRFCRDRLGREGMQRLETALLWCCPEAEFLNLPFHWGFWA